MILPWNKIKDVRAPGTENQVSDPKAIPPDGKDNASLPFAKEIISK